MVKWGTIQLPKDLGRLEVGDILLKNVVMLYKWWWRFVNNEKPLWKKIVSSYVNGMSL